MKSEQILQQHKMRITQSRKAVLEAFIQNQHALAQPDIEKMVNGICDRVTIYRIIESFLSQGIIHKVPDNEGKQKFALCLTCDVHHHQHEHLHFKCTTCHKTECLDEIPFPTVNIPKGYQFTEWSLLIEGVCANCNLK